MSILIRFEFRFKLDFNLRFKICGVIADIIHYAVKNLKVYMFCFLIVTFKEREGDVSVSSFCICLMFSLFQLL